tara:strand:- start:6219 stop:6461 length:243 start_codon:yes stop_codon:yes gene_type:complete
MEENNSPNADDLINVNNTVILTNLPEGQKIKLRDGSTAEVTANPRDGGWVFIKVLESPDDPSSVGSEDMAFATDVIGLVD